MASIEEKAWMPYYPEDVNAEVTVPNKTLYHILEETVRNYPNHKAIIYNDDSLTYTELKDKIDRLATAWKDLGFKKGERIGIMLMNTPYYFVAYYAAVKIGLIIIQINPYYTSRELIEIVNDSGTNYLIVQESGLEKALEVKKVTNITSVFTTKLVSENALTTSLDELIENSHPQEIKETFDVENDVAVIQYTGGTTGKSKGAMLTHSNLVANVIQSHAIYGATMQKGTEIVLTATPLYHVYAMTSAMNLGIYIGATNILIEKYEINSVLATIKKYQPTYFPGVPRMYNDFVNHPQVEEYGLDCFQHCSCGSAPLPIELIKKFESITNARIAEGFGLTESSPSTHRNPPHGLRKIGSIGIPLPGTNCKVVDDEGKEVEPNQIGELIIKGPQVMKGYWNNESETNKSLRNGWLYTSDLARQDEQGYFYIVGRKKEMIITNGFNVYPQEIENVLYEHTDIKETAVVGVQDDEVGEIVKAFIVLKEGSTVTKDELKGHCYKSLTPYKVPKSFIFIDELPRNNVGKILKRELIDK